MTDQPPAAPPANDVLSRLRAFLAALSPRQKWIAAGIVAAIVVLLLVIANGAGGRQISVNGQRLGAQEIAFFDASVGAAVPNGNYWLDPRTGAFGRAGNMQPIGVLTRGREPAASPYAAQSPAPDMQNPYAYGPDPQTQYPQQQQPRDWGDVGQNDRGPFGDYMSDGECSFVNGVAVGNC